MPIELIPFRQEHIEKTFELIQDPTVRTLFAMNGEPDFTQHLTYWNTILNDKTQQIFALYYNENHIGNCGLKNIKQDSAEIWIYIGEKNLWGQGLGTIACKTLIQKSFEIPNIKTLCLHVLFNNTAAIKMYKKIGFQCIELNEDSDVQWANKKDSILKMQYKQTVAMMQPTFMPWQGFFELIYSSDSFVFLDNFQFSVQTRHTRCELFNSAGSTAHYSVPIQKAKCFQWNINETLIVTDNFWKTKMKKKLESNYRKALYYNEIHPYIENWLNQPYSILSEINISFILMVCNILDLKRNFLYSSAIGSHAKRSTRVFEILQWAGAGKYLSAFGSFGYIKEDGVFPNSEVELLFQNFEPAPYSQVGSSSFVPYLSILDALYNIGSKETLELIATGTKKWLTWDDMNEK